MATVGVRELKNRLSHYLDLAKKGETVTVTERGKEIVQISALGSSPEKELMWRLVREGKVTWNGGKPTGLDKPIKTRGKPASEMVIEDRG